MSPNLAARPFLNTRPVWAVMAAAVAIAVVVGGLLLGSHFVSNRALAEEIAAINDLQAAHDALDREVRAAARGLDRVPWKSLGARIDATNSILREHRFSWLDLLQDLEEVLPYDVRLVKVAPKIDWQFLFVIGIFFGSLIASTTSKSFRIQAVPSMWESRFGPSKLKRGIVAFVGGVFAMFGARLADG